MKKILAIILVAVAVLGLAACGSDTDGGTSDKAQSTVSSEKTAKELAVGCKDKPVSELVKLIGEPKAKEYVPSCLNPGVGEDGFWEYDGFTVYTYRADGKETVYEVE